MLRVGIRRGSVLKFVIMAVRDLLSALSLYVVPLHREPVVLRERRICWDLNTTFNDRIELAAELTFTESSAVELTADSPSVHTFFWQSRCGHDQFIRRETTSRPGR